MKALSLTQPWASLVAIGAKTIETRSWNTTYRGPLAIHAAHSFPRDCRDLCATPPFLRALTRAGLSMPELPRGAILAVVDLCNVSPTALLGGFSRKTLAGFKVEPIEYHVVDLGKTWDVTETEIAFGDYAYGRYAWMFDNLRPLRQPVPWRGALGLWTVREEIEARVLEQITVEGEVGC